MLKTIKVALISSSLLITLSSWAFWSLPYKVYAEDHGSITRYGIAKYVYTLTDTYFKNTKISGDMNPITPLLSKKHGFSFNGMLVLAESNEYVDDNEETIDNDIYHCDNEKIDACSTLVFDSRKDIIENLNKVIYNSKKGIKDHVSFNTLRMKLGESLHTLQDFYSHSNWVERHLYGTQGKIRIDNNFKKINGKVPVNIDFFLEKDYAPTLSEVSTCITGPAWNDNNTTLYNDLYLDNLTTGYYKKSNNIYQAKNDPALYGNNRSHKFCNIPGLVSGKFYCTFEENYSQQLGFAEEVEDLLSNSREVNVNEDGPYYLLNKDGKATGIEKCIHSVSIRGKLPAHVGIAKDHKFSIHHGIAFDVAIRATTIYVKSIIDEVVKQSGKGIHTDWAILKFLGYDVHTPDNYTPIVVETPKNISHSRNGDYVSFKWNKVANATGYKLYISKDISDVLNDPNKDIYSLVDNTIDVLLESNENYYAVIEAYQDEFKSPISSAHKVPLQRLPIPTNFTAERDGDSIKFTWDKVAGAEKYQLAINEKLYDSNGISGYLAEGSTNYPAISSPSLELILDKSKVYYAFVRALKGNRSSNEQKLKVETEDVINVKLSIPSSLSREEGNNKFVPFAFSPLALKDTVDSVSCSTNPDIGDLQGTPSKQGVSFIAPQANAIPSFTMKCEALSAIGSVLSTSNNLVVTVTKAVVINNPPVAKITTDKSLPTLTEGDSFNLKGGTSTDPDTGDSIASYLWKEGTTTLGTSVNLPLNNIIAGSRTISLTVTDKGGLTNTAEVTFTVKAKTNTAPVASINGNPAIPRLQITVNDGETVSLDASSSTDADSDTLTYKWLDVGTGTIFNETISFSKIFAVGVHIVTLQVNDGTVTSEAKVRVEVKEIPNTAPVASINGNPALPRLQITVNDGETVSLDASSSTDADSDTLTYKWLDVGTGTIFNETISFSKVFAVGVHIVTLQVNDGTVTSEAKVRVEVKEIPNTAPVASINSNPALPRLQIIVNDGETVSLDASSSTDADSDTLTYKWLDVETGTIFSEAITFSKVFAVGIHIVTLQVNDGTVTSEAKVRVEVKEVLIFGKLNDTGIIKCGSNTSNNILCPVAGSPNQDAQTGRDVFYNDNSDGRAGFSFTKISNTGSNLLPSATSWSCVKDNVTGLMWEIKTGTGSHYSERKFTWYNPDTTTNGGNSGTENDSNDTDSFVKEVNNEKLCGFSDWRLPTKHELGSLVDFSIEEPGPTIDGDYFPNTGAAYFGFSHPYYWTSSQPLNAFTPASTSAWSISFGNGSNVSLAKYGERFIRLVRIIH